MLMFDHFRSKETWIDIKPILWPKHNTVIVMAYTKYRGDNQPTNNVFMLPVYVMQQ